MREFNVNDVLMILAIVFVLYIPVGTYMLYGLISDGIRTWREVQLRRIDVAKERDSSITVKNESSQDWNLLRFLN